MKDAPIVTRPISKNEELIREKFYQRLVAQSDLMDKLSGQLLTLELAIPGIYATLLKLVNGDNVTVYLNSAFYLAFFCWFLSLALSLASLIPRKWNVDPSVLKQAPDQYDQGLGIEDFFRKSAQHKRRLVIASSVLLFLGIFSAAYTMG
jgi:hypothetical protein